MLIAFCAVGVILWVGGHDVFAGRLSAGELSAFVFYAFVVATGAGTVSEVWGELQRAAGATERLMEILDTRPGIAAPAVPAPRPRAYRRSPSTRSPSPIRRGPGTPALDRFSLAVSQGERVALVGPSGAGKTTVLALLLRFYDPQSGALRIGGTDLRDFDPRRAAAPDRGGAAGSGDLRRQRARQRALRPAGGEPRGGRARLRAGLRAGIHRPPAAGPGHACSASAA